MTDSAIPAHANTDRHAAVHEILQLMQERHITMEELLSASRQAAGATYRSGAGGVALKVFSYLGGIFILGGISAYISMFWPTMSSFMRIFVTLGVGLGLSALSAVVMKEGKYPKLVVPLIIAAALIEITGWFVFVDELFPHTGDIRKAEAFAFGVMALQHWMVFFGFRRASLLFFALTFSYGFFESLLSLGGMQTDCIAILLGASLLCVSDGLEKSPYKSIANIGFSVSAWWLNAGIYDYLGFKMGWAAATVASGLTLCSLAYGLKLSGKTRLSAFGFFIGSIVFYSGLFDEVEHTHFELLFLGVAIALMYVQALLESRSLLITSTIAILGFIAYYTEEHFIRSAGWPVALILLGVAFFAVGAFALRQGKKY